MTAPRPFAAARAALPPLALAAAPLLALLACFDSPVKPAPPSGKVDCAELSDSVFAGADSAGPPQYRIVAPNGGQTFRVGDTMRVLVAGVNASSSLLEIWRFSRAGNRSAKLPGSPDTSFNPRSDCEFRFAVPESLISGSGADAAFSLVSDSIKVKVAHYFQGDRYYDYSDSLIRIGK